MMGTCKSSASRYTPSETTGITLCRIQTSAGRDSEPALKWNGGPERGCVEDQPQRVGSSKAAGACGVLRLVEDDTAALRSAVAFQNRLSGSRNVFVVPIRVPQARRWETLGVTL